MNRFLLHLIAVCMAAAPFAQAQQCEMQDLLGGGAIHISADGSVIAAQTYGAGFRLACQPTHACQADMNGDGALDFLDLSLFITLHQQQVPATDFNGDGLFNFFDFSEYLTAFNAGCP